MPGLPSSEAGDFLVPFVPGVTEPVVRSLQHGLRPPIFRVYISWARGSLLHVACVGEDPADASVGGKVVEVRLTDGEVNEARGRKLAYGSVPAFAVYQSKKNSMALLERLSPSPERSEWWQHVLDYSLHIKNLLGSPKGSPSVIEDPKMVIDEDGEPSSMRAAWQLLEMFYVDKQSSAWLPEKLVDWLAEYDSFLSYREPTIHSKLSCLQKKLLNVQIVEDDPEYWEGVASALAVGWIDAVVKLLRLHGSYQPDQLDNRETENGLVEAVAVLISAMPRMRPDLPSGKLGQCYKTKPDFVKAWEKWRGHIAKLDCSAFWVQCGHRQTREGLKNLLQIMLGNAKNLSSSTFHWIELYISYFLYLRPLTVGFEGMYSLAQKCLRLKPMSESVSLISLLIGILGENTEVVLAECSRSFGPWMVVHATELLTAGSDEAEILLHDEHYNLGGVNIEELNRLVYSQVLSSHASTWQIAPTYLASCPTQGLGLLEIMLYKQPVQLHHVLLKNLEICRLYELENISTGLMKITGIHLWKHGRKGSGIYWLQQARDEFRLSRIAQELFDGIGKSLSDDSFKQWGGLIELLGSDVSTVGGLEFLHKYCDFKRAIQNAQAGEATTEATQKAMQFLIQLMKNAATPKRFWLPLLHDSVKLLNWSDRPLLNVAETNLLLNKLQELSLARLRPDCDVMELPSQALSSVRLALATNLARAIMEEH